jgi:hypothetical protein
LKRNLLIAICLGTLLLVFSTGLFLFYVGRQLARGTLLFGISEELLANPPIASEPGIANRITHGIDPISLLNDQPTGAGNAATYYVDVVRSVAERRADATAPDAQSDGSLLIEEDLKTFMEGVRQVNCDFSSESLILGGKPVRLAPVVDFSDNLDHVSWLRKIAQAVIDRGSEYETDAEAEKARRCYEAVVKFGVDIEAGRESILQVFLGAAVQRMGVEKLISFYTGEGDPAKAEQWRNYLADLETFISSFKNKTNKLIRSAGLTPETVANGLWVLQHEEDPLFRREVLSTLRISRILAPDVVDPVLEDIAANDPDSYVREAAQNALKSMSAQGQEVNRTSDVGRKRAPAESF